jgi:4-deoxy-L-threo-5-hexosulose-uronate ketol-isomerase
MTIMHRTPDSIRTRTLSTDELRGGFLVTSLWVPGEIHLRHLDLDRAVIGGVMPQGQPLVLEAPASFAAAFFTERRELGILNIGGTGAVTTDGARHVLQSRDVLYVGRGTKRIVFESDVEGPPARFYLVSYPAHATHPTTHVVHTAAQGDEIGTAERANRRRLAKYIHPGGVASAQLVMGVTALQSGSVWNTMPAHTHLRRSELYLYFDVPPDAMVVHLMGEADETRHLIVRDGDVVLSPPWSMHAGCGTSNYSFCWAMGGENQDFADMQAIDMRDLK